MLSFLFFGITLCWAFSTPEKVSPAIYASMEQNRVYHDTTEAYWQHLKALCGQSFRGRIIAAPAGDTTFTGKRLVMHVSYCSDHEIRIPFHVGDNHSRTWILTRTSDRITLKHDHRKPDGSDDQLTQYGGTATNPGLSTRQTFPADNQSWEMIPEAASNVWMMEIIPGKTFTYKLRRLGTERYFRVEFDLTREVETPPVPWGW